jgi:hypothetical protein
VACAAGTPPNAQHQADASTAGADASKDAAPASVDAPAPTADAGSGSGVMPSCTISTGVTPVLTGTNDLAQYPGGNQLAPGAPLGSDGAGILWDATNLYVTVTSDGFENQFEPLHIYLETGSQLAAAVPSSGKQYSNLTPQLPFTAGYLIAARQVSDSGMGGPYDGVYTPDSSWDDQATPLGVGTNVWVSSDDRTISVAVPWSALGGCPTEVRLTTHVVNAVLDNEWKELVPATTTPWVAPGGDYFDIDLTQPPAVATFTLD